MEAGEGWAERRRRRFSGGGGGDDALRRFWPPQRRCGSTHRLRHQDCSADTSARESPGGPVASPPPGEVREGAARETDAARGRRWVVGDVVDVGRRFGTGELVGELDRSGAATLGRRHGGGDRRRGWPEGLRSASAPSRSRVLREVVNVVDDEHGHPIRWDAKGEDRGRLTGVGRAAETIKIDRPREV